MSTKQKITPCFWFNGNALEAAEMYGSIFPDTRIVGQSPFVVEINMSGHNFILLNGGPRHQPNASVSLYYISESEIEFSRIWDSLSQGGHVLIPVENRPGIEKYGWVNDKFGVSWQLALGNMSGKEQKIKSCFSFSGKRYGSALAAMKYYTSIFTSSAIDEIQYESDKTDIVSHAHFTLAGQKFIAMDVNLQAEFNEGVSHTINCSTQDEIDHYWHHLTSEGFEDMCGWVKDKYGVSWQVIPDILGTIMQDPERAGKAAEAFMKMRKLNIQEIEQASLRK